MSNIASVGQRFNGKSTLALHMAQKASVRVIFDATPGRNTFPRNLPHQSIATTVAGVRAAMQTLGARDLDDPTGASEIAEVLVLPFDDLPGMFDATCEEVRAWLEADQDTLDAAGLVLLVDEASMVSKREMPAPFDYLARSADYEKFHLIVTTHMPQHISPVLRSITNYWCIFQTTDSNALQVIRERCGDDVADEVQILGKREYIFFDDATRAYDIRRNATVWAPRARPEVAA